MQGIRRTIKRRRLESKTDYHARLALLKSPMPRVIVRKTNRYIIGQLVTSDRAQDKVIVSASSKDLVAQGWSESLSGSLKSIPAAYLTGALLASKIEGKKEAILDIGMQRNVKKGRIYAFLKGLVDSGVKIPHNDSSLPDDKRLEENTKTREIFIKLKGKIGEHGRKGK